MLVTLRETSSNALAACIAAYGGLIPNDVRGTLDSIAQTCLSELYSRGCGASPILSHSQAKRSLLLLGTNCSCVPWGDGGRCAAAVASAARAASGAMRGDPDASVSSSALSALCVLDALATPRAPPIVVPARGAAADGSGNGGGGLTASAMLRGMAELKAQAVSSADGGAKAERRSKKSSKRAKKETAEKEAIAQPEEPKITPSDGSPENTKEPNAVEATREESKAASDEASAERRGPLNPNSKVPLPVAKDSESDKPAVEEKEPTRSDKSGIQDEEMIVEPTEDHAEEVQKSESDDPGDAMDMSAADAFKTDEKNHSDDDSEGSLDDFPDIIDEDPDEEDMH